MGLVRARICGDWIEPVDEPALLQFCIGPCLASTASINDLCPVSVQVSYIGRVKF